MASFGDSLVPATNKMSKDATCVLYVSKTVQSDGQVPFFRHIYGVCKNR